MSDYVTVAHDGTDEIIEKRSRFIGYCRPVTTESAALDFIAEIRARHRDARHNVYAYVLRGDNLMRYSDDGEPAGTAGMPTLDVLRKGGVTDCALVVTRYFGGVLLGTGGLVRAYTEAAQKAVAAAEKIKMVECAVYEIRTGYTDFGKIQYKLNENLYTIRDTKFGEETIITACCALEQSGNFEKMILDVTNGNRRAEYLCTEYISQKID